MQQIKPSFTDQDFYQLFPQGLPKGNENKQRPLYPYEIRALRAIYNIQEPHEIVTSIEFDDTTVRFHHHSFEEIQEQRLLASHAYQRRQTNYEDTLSDNERDDRSEASDSAYNNTGHFSNQEHCNIESSWYGDTPIPRFWYYSSISDIDKTHNLHSSYIPEINTVIDTSNHDSIYYRVPKEEYQAIITNLSPDQREREYGRVFFLFEIKYTDRYIETLTDTTTLPTIRSFYREGTTKIYSSTYTKPGKGSLFKESQTGSILKYPTLKGIVWDNIFRYIEEIRFAQTHVPVHYLPPVASRLPRNALNRLEFPTYPPYGPPREGYVAQSLYYSISRPHIAYDFATFFYNIRLGSHLHEPEFSFKSYPNEHFVINPYTTYYENINRLEQDVLTALRTQITCRNWIKKIQRIYRSHLSKRIQPLLPYYLSSYDKISTSTIISVYHQHGFTDYRATNRLIEQYLHTQPLAQYD